MPLSKYEIERITQIVAGKEGEQLTGKQLREVVDRVVDALEESKGNREIKGVTCETSATETEHPSSPLPTVTEAPTTKENSTTEPLNQAGLYQQIENTKATRVIVAAFGHNRPGVVAAITTILGENNCSILDISQTILQDFFSMIMVVDIAGSPLEFAPLRELIQATEAQLGMKVYVMHEDIFRYMHRI